jgi:hypothetical protein
LEFTELDLNENENNDGKNKQKIYLPFIFLPLFYMLDFISFKCFLSEVVAYDSVQNIFLLNNKEMNNALKKIYRKCTKVFYKLFSDKRKE